MMAMSSGRDAARLKWMADATPVNPPPIMAIFSTGRCIDVGVARYAESEMCFAVVCAHAPSCQFFK